MTAAAATALTTGWTVAYRKPRANRFLRVDLDLGWHGAQLLANRVKAAEPGLQVWITSTAGAETDGRVPAEDVGNLLVDTGRRIAIKEGGQLPAEVAVPTAAEEAAAEAEYRADDVETGIEDLAPAPPADDLAMEFQLTGPDGGTGYIRRGGRERNALIEFDGQQWSVCYAGEAEIGYGANDALAAAALMREIGYRGTCSLTIVDETADWTRTTMIIDDEYGTRTDAPEAPVADEQPAAAPVARPAHRRPARDVRRPGAKATRRAANKRARASRRANRR